MAGDFRPVAPVDPTNLRPMLFLDVARQMMLDDGWSHRAVSVFCLALIARRETIVWDIGGVKQPPLPLERMARELPSTPQDVPLHPAAAAVWQAHGYLP